METSVQDIADAIVRDAAFWLLGQKDNMEYLSEDGSLFDGDLVVDFREYMRGIVKQKYGIDLSGGYETERENTDIQAR